MQLRRTILTLTLIVSLVWSFDAASVKAASTKRRPPYDLGCIIVPAPPGDDCVDWEEARKGTLRGAKVPLAYLGYSWPPFPVLTTYHFTTLTGVYVDLPQRSSVRVSAVIRTVGVGDVPKELNLEGCLGVMAPPEDGVVGSDYGCKPLAPGGQTTRLVTEFKEGFRKGFEPGRVALFVHLRGGPLPASAPREVLVESISYTANPFALSRKSATDSP